MLTAPLPSPRPSRWRHVLAAGLTLAVCAATAHAQTAGRVRMTKSFHAVTAVGEPAQTATAATVRDTLTDAEASKPMQIHLPMRLRNAAELERRVMANEIVSREEMAARFLPDAKDYQVVADWLTAQGLTVKPAGASHAAVRAVGTPTQLEKAFEVHFARVQFHGEEHTSSTVAPTLPAEIEARVSSIHGLQPHLHPSKNSVVADPKANNGFPPFYVGDVLNVYDAATSLHGAGQAVGILIDTMADDDDLTKYWTKNQVPQKLSNITVVDVNDFGDLTDFEGEATLDTEWSSGVAYAGQVVVFASGDLQLINDSYSALLDALQAGTYPNLHQVSMSYGAGEVSDETAADIASVHDYFTAISAYGVTLFASSGDQGAYGNNRGKVEASYPATDPLVTAVGATALVLTAKDAVLDEQGWSISGLKDEFGVLYHESSGGGYSVVFDRPDYQVGLGVDVTKMRQVPDVSILGDPNTPGYVRLEGQDVAFGGTSLSSPIWAGLCAIINQGRAVKGLAPVGRLNSLVYPLMDSTDFRDIRRGTDGLYNCTKGYDLLTGIGSPYFQQLYHDLTVITTPPDAFFAGAAELSNGMYYLAFANGNIFGYYSYLSDPGYIYHMDLGYEYVFDAQDGQAGVYLYDFKSGDFFYTSPTFSFPYLYDFALNTVLYYYPDPNNPGRYNTNGVRYFYNFATQQIITR